MDPCCEACRKYVEPKTFLQCSLCKSNYHHMCINIKKAQFSKLSEEFLSSWICPSCNNVARRAGSNCNTPVRSQIPTEPTNLSCVGLKTSEKDCTPIRNVSTTRGSKRPALNSPPDVPYVTSDKVRAIVEDVVRAELDTMLEQIKCNMIDIINKELAPLKKEIGEVNEAMAFINNKFESIKADQMSTKKSLNDLKEENRRMDNTLSDLTQRLNYLEQQSRLNNIEIQCVPEKRDENVYTLVKQLGTAVNYEITDKEILHGTRTAKINKDNIRPRAIVVQLASPRIRDSFLASVIKFNKAHTNNKLNSAHLGFIDNNNPIYVMEHLSPTTKALHAATRQKAKEKGFKFVWVRNGKIFVRKNTESEHILIRDKETLKKLN